MGKDYIRPNKICVTPSMWPCNIAGQDLSLVITAGNVHFYFTLKYSRQLNWLPRAVLGWKCGSEIANAMSAGFKQKLSNTEQCRSANPDQLIWQMSWSDFFYFFIFFIYLGDQHAVSYAMKTQLGSIFRKRMRAEVQMMMCPKYLLPGSKCTHINTRKPEKWRQKTDIKESLPCQTLVCFAGAAPGRDRKGLSGRCSPALVQPLVRFYWILTSSFPVSEKKQLWTRCAPVQGTPESWWNRW